MRPPKIAMASLAFALLGGTAGASGFPTPPPDDPNQIVLEGDLAGAVLVASAITTRVEAGPAAAWFDVMVVPAPRSAPPEPRLVVLEDPEEILRENLRTAGFGGPGTPSMLDLVLILCAPFVLPLIARRRSMAQPLEWPDDEDGLQRSSPM